jgi:hypothetical protein
VDQLQLLERLDRLITGAAAAGRHTLVHAPGCPGSPSITPTSPWSPAAPSVLALSVEVVPGCGGWILDEAATAPGSHEGDELADLPKPTNLWGLAGGR